MKTLTVAICLTFSVILGSAGMNYASSKDLNPNRDDRSIWKGTEWEKRIDGWVYKIKFNDSGNQYTVNITGPDGISPCSGRVERDGALSLSTCESESLSKVSTYTPRLEISGDVDTISISVETFGYHGQETFWGLSNVVTFDELERKLAKFTQNNQVGLLAKLNRKQAEEKRQEGLARKAAEAKRLAELKRIEAEEKGQGTEGPPYWAGYQAILKSLATDENFEGHISLSMKYSQDGKIYYANGSYVRGAELFDCTGEIDEEGNLEEQDCTPSGWWGYKRTLMGHVTNPIIENSGHGTTPGGEFPDKELLRNETTQKAKAKNLAELKQKQKQAKKIRQAELERKTAEAEVTENKNQEELKVLKSQLEKLRQEVKRKASQAQAAKNKRQAGLARKAVEAKRLAELKRIEAEEERQKTLARKAAEAERLAELKRIEVEEKRQEILARKAVEAKRLAELKRIEAEEKRQKTLARFGSYHALVIGNNDYKHLPKLENAVQDARDIADVLERLYGFEVQTIENASRTDIINALVKLRAKLTWDNNLLIYYAGHGTIDEYTSRGYWQPVEAEEDNLTFWVPNSTITDMLTAIRAKHIMVVADSCYSGTLVRSAQGGLRTANDRDAWVQRASQKRSRTALVSGGIEPVMDGGGGKNSVFAKALLDVLQNNQSVVDGATLFDGLKRNVVLGSEQTPQYSDIRNSEHDGGEFFFVRKTLPLNQSSAPAGADPLKAIKTECAALGFTKGTEKYGDCVMKLFR